MTEHNEALEVRLQNAVKNLSGGLGNLLADCEETDWEAVNKLFAQEQAPPLPLLLKSKIAIKNMRIGSGLLTLSGILTALLSVLRVDVNQFAQAAELDNRYLKDVLAYEGWKKLAELVSDVQNMACLQKTLDISFENLEWIVKADLPWPSHMHAISSGELGIEGGYDEASAENQVEETLEPLRKFLGDNEEFSHLLR